ncbi:MBL fold metallo-hydrolase [Candidatus Bipolaricaulota bacterium]|nr:MBL fold metallo-hydrolase [Candidatus Bipolaricaulota bacterium]
MTTRLKFLGAAGNVTGSSYLLEEGEERVLIDCGLYQEREFRSRKWEPFPFEPAAVDAVILTHAHLDHCGLLPKLVNGGFNGNIFCTGATAEIAKVILLDSAKIQQFDAAQKKKRHRVSGKKPKYPEKPLYTVEEAKEVFPLFTSVSYEESVGISKALEFSLHDAGHILGSASVQLKTTDGQERTFIFSGDLGRWDRPILRNPSTFNEADYIQIESTYGDRTHEPSEQILERLSEVINSTEGRGGNVVIPSFALGRAQEVLFYLNKLLIEDRIPHLLVFLDSPMATEITKVFKKHANLYDKEMKKLTETSRSPFDFPSLKLVSDQADSKSINHLKGTSVIISSSGMCTGGRIKHHLVHNIYRPESTILFVGYQARGTLGREIVEGKDPVRILGEEREVKAQITRLGGLSAHADKEELMRWLNSIENQPRRVFVTHGEGEAVREFASSIKKERGWPFSSPNYGTEFELT